MKKLILLCTLSIFLMLFSFWAKIQTVEETEENGNDSMLIEADKDKSTIEINGEKGR